MKNRKCQQCGDNIPKEKRKNGKFCCRECFADSQRKKPVDKICKQCNQVYNGSGKKYCSKKCQHAAFNGIGNPMYIGSSLKSICKTCKTPFEYYIGSSTGIYCSRKCHADCPDFAEKLREANIGKKMSIDTRVKMSKSRKGVEKSKQHGMKIREGVLKFYDNVGRCPDAASFVRSSIEYREWRKGVLKRDNYKCVKCGGAEKLEVDHIVPFASLLSECEVIKDISPMYNIGNGRTLCKPCHKLTLSFAQKTHQQLEFRVINELKQLHKANDEGFTLFKDYYEHKMEKYITFLKNKMPVR